MLCKSAETCHPVSLPCKGTNILIFVTCGASFTCGYDLYNHRCNLYTHGWDVFTCKNVLCTHSYVFYSHGCNKFLHARTFFTLADATSIHMLVHLLFTWVQCQSLKPILSQCSQTSFVTVDDFIALCNPSYDFYSYGCNKFLHARIFFTLADHTNFYRDNQSLAPC